MTQVPRPVPPTGQIQLPAQTNATPATTQLDFYDSSNPREVVRQKIPGATNKLLDSIDKQVETEKLLKELSEEIKKDDEDLKGKILEIGREREEHRRKIYTYVQARDEAQAIIRKDQANITPGVFNFNYSYYRSTDLSIHVNLKNQSEGLIKKEEEIVGKEKTIAEMKKKLDEKEARKHKLEEQLSNTIEEYLSMKQQIFDVLNSYSPVRNGTPTDQRPQSSLPSGSNGGQKRGRWGVNVSSPADFKKKNIAVDDQNQPSSSTSASIPSNFTSPPPTYNSNSTNLENYFHNVNLMSSDYKSPQRILSSRESTPELDQMSSEPANESELNLTELIRMIPLKTVPALTGEQLVEKTNQLWNEFSKITSNLYKKEIEWKNAKDAHKAEKIKFETHQLLLQGQSEEFEKKESEFITYRDKEFRTMLDKKNFKYGVLSDDDDFLIDYEVKNLDEVKARNAVIRKMKNEYKKNIEKCATLKNIVGDLKVKEEKAKEELDEAETAFKGVFVTMISTFGRRILMMSDSSECSSDGQKMAKRVRLEDKGSSTPIPDSKMNNGSAVPNSTPTASAVTNGSSNSAVLLKKERKRK